MVKKISRKRQLLRSVARMAVVSVAAMPWLDSQARAQVPASSANEEVILQADSMTHDRVSDVVAAIGNVEFVQENRILRADEVRYDRRSGQVKAVGNVTILQETGEVMFANEVQLDEKLRNGLIRQIRIVMSDDSRMAAASGQRIDGRISKLNKAVYSPCKPCRENPDHEMPWQLKAERVVHDSVDKTIEYEHAWLEVFGFPIAYIPYFSHPDPSVERKSGFLTPSYGNSSVYGNYIETPYYYAFSNQQDVTVTPLVTEKDGVIGQVEYRHLLETGNLAVDASGSFSKRTDDDERRFRGHLDAEGSFDINRLWRWGFDIEHASDDNYLRRYGFNGRDILENRLFVEGFDDQNYVSLETLAWQPMLTDDDPGESPFVWPRLTYEHYGQTDPWGGRIRYAGHFLNLTRDEGSDNTRAIGEMEYKLPFHSAWGDQVEFQVGTQLRAYLVDTNNLAQDDGAKDGGHGSIWPWIDVTWSRPYAKPAGSAMQYFEPIVQFHASPYGSTGGAPNNDSVSLTIDESNLFATNRFAGFDRLSGGPRVTWGARYSILGASGGHSSFFLGQSYRPSDDGTYPAGSGFDDELSDIIASWQISPGKGFDMNSSISLGGDDGELNRAETQMVVGPDFLQASLTHARVKAEASQTEFSDEEQIDGGLYVKWTDDWESRAGVTYDLQDDKMIQWSVSSNHVFYDCVVFGVKASETFTESEDVPSSFSINFTIQLINLG